MELDNIFSKINSKDYNNQLEKILEDKNYPEAIKNLLLSMLYKIEAGYKDYETVKKVVENQKEYIDEILNIIKDKCKEIIIVDKNIERQEELGNSNFSVDKLAGKIYLKYPNERLLLYTLYKLDDKQIYLNEKYNLIRISFSELLNSGENINNIEVLRDFNGWNWNTQASEIPELTTNLIYQNLVYLLGIDFLKELIHTEKVIDHIELIENKLQSKYGKENTKEMLNKMYKISLIICTSKNKKEFERLKDEKEDIEKEYNRLQDKTNLLNEISEIKKRALKEIKNIDNILNDNSLLEQEFIKRNEKRAQYNKIVNLIHLKEILNKERNKLLKKIEEQNYLLDPKHYVELTTNLKEQLEMLQYIELEEDKKEEKKREYLVDLQKLFLKCFSTKINKAEHKEEIISLIYMFRYYRLINLKENQQIINVPELQEELCKTWKVLLKKAYDLKVLNRITDEEETNIKIISKVLATRIINLENITIELYENMNMLNVNIYDADVYEKATIISKYDKEKLLVKLNKKIKLFE